MIEHNKSDSLKMWRFCLDDIYNINTSTGKEWKKWIKYLHTLNEYLNNNCISNIHNCLIDNSYVLLSEKLI